MTILRKAEHVALSKITLSGRVLDLGGDKRSEYRKLFQGTFSLVTANMSNESNPDIICDLEEPLPVEDSSFEGVLLINLLEHVFEYRKLLHECARVLKNKGVIVVVVPFMFPYHPSPRDFHRYTKETLSRVLSEAGFREVHIEALGSGMNAARWLFLQRLLPGFLQPISIIIDPLVIICDKLFVALARALGRKYDPSDYALGYIATARKIR